MPPSWEGATPIMLLTMSTFDETTVDECISAVGNQTGSSRRPKGGRIDRHAAGRVHQFGWRFWTKTHPGVSTSPQGEPLRPLQSWGPLIEELTHFELDGEMRNLIE